MMPERLAYQALLESLADGADIDWGALDTGAASDVERRRYRNLRLVARVAELHRTAVIDDPAPAAPADVSAATAPAAWGHLEVRERIAGGCYGDVYRARDPQLNREVALKLLRPPASAARPLDQLLAEARTLAAVRHANVVTVYGADVRDGRAGLWMELVHGRTLESWLQAHQSMGAGEATSVGVDLCRALAAVHAAGLVHGDVKTQNVMREEGGRIVLMDFGAGRAQGANAGAFAGTPLYLAPEVLAGAAPTPRSDIYSLGVLLFYLLNGTYPCTADNLDALRTAHADGVRSWLRDRRPDLPAVLVQTIERALEADPARRFTTAGEMERALSSSEHAAPRRPMASSWLIACGATLVAALALLVALPARPGHLESIAVLPFVSAGASADQDHLLEGLTTDLVREMQRFDLGVKSTALKAAALGPSQRARLGTAGFVQGELRRTGTRKAVTITVVRAGGQPLWSHEYDVYDTAVPALARTIASDVAAALGAGPRPDAPAPARPANYRAYEAYQRGRVLAEERTESSLRRAIECFKEAVSLDAAYAEPLAALADAYATLGVPAFGPLSPLEARRLSRQFLNQALRLDPNLVEAHTALAYTAFLHDWDWDTAQIEFDKALALNPQSAQAHYRYAEFLNEMGRFDRALAEIHRAQDLDPLSNLIDRDVAWHLFCQRRYDEAIAQLRNTLTLYPTYGAALTLLARSLAAKGEYEEARAVLDSATKGTSEVFKLGVRGYIEAASGQRHDAEGTITELRDHGRREYVSPYYLALVYTALGRSAEAVSELERSYVEQDSVLVTVNIDPRFDPLRKDPGFQALVAKMKFPAH